MLNTAFTQNNGQAEYIKWREGEKGVNGDLLLEKVKKVLPPARFQHTLGVRETALELARRFGADLKRAESAAILHDYAKYFPLDELEKIIRSTPEIPQDVLEYSPELWHAFAGAAIVKQELGITDEEVLAAIRYHTTGRPQMSILEKVVFLADYIEPGRKFPGVEEVRKLALTDLDQAVCQALKRTIDFLEGNNKKVYPLTKEAYRYLVQTADEAEGKGVRKKEHGDQ